MICGDSSNSSSYRFCDIQKSWNMKIVSSVKRIRTRAWRHIIFIFSSSVFFIRPVKWCPFGSFYGTNRQIFFTSLCKDSRTTLVFLSNRMILCGFCWIFFLTLFFFVCVHYLFAIFHFMDGLRYIRSL